MQIKSSMTTNFKVLLSLGTAYTMVFAYCSRYSLLESFISVRMKAISELIRNKRRVEDPHVIIPEARGLSDSSCYVIFRVILPVEFILVYILYVRYKRR